MHAQNEPSARLWGARTAELKNALPCHLGVERPGRAPGERGVSGSRRRLYGGRAAGMASWYP